LAETGGNCLVGPPSIIGIPIARKPAIAAPKKLGLAGCGENTQQNQEQAYDYWAPVVWSHSES
jgi:hypothetical protein